MTICCEIIDMVNLQYGTDIELTAHLLCKAKRVKKLEVGPLVHMPRAFDIKREHIVKAFAQRK
jgi:hypothetical protein